MIDGDTFRVPEWKTRRVRLPFVDAPEREQVGGAIATAALARLAYVRQNTTFLNRWVVEEGYAAVEVGLEVLTIAGIFIDGRR